VKRLSLLFEHRIYVLLALTWLVLASYIPGFLTSSTTGLVLGQASIAGLMAIGVTVTVIAGQLDLSVGSTVALSGIVAIELQKYMPPVTAALLAPLVGVLVGVVNGLLTTKARINSFIVTLGTMIAVRGVGYLVVHSQPVAARDFAFGLQVDQRLFWVLTPRMLTLLIVAVLVQLWLSYTRSGRNTFAVGGSPEAARLAGLSADTYVIGAFMISGLTAGIGGVLLALSLDTGSPVVAQQDLIIVFAAVIIGGTSLAGGRGGTMATLAGILIISGLTAGMNFKSVQFYYQSIVIGSILVLVVLIDSVYQSYRTRIAARNPSRLARERPPILAVADE
jgi:ribose/xylose/arabinose/galactoside ABC-type transport system permease subunit